MQGRIQDFHWKGTAGSGAPLWSRDAVLGGGAIGKLAPFRARGAPLLAGGAPYLLRGMRLCAFGVVVELAPPPIECLRQLEYSETTFQQQMYYPIDVSYGILRKSLESGNFHSGGVTPTPTIPITQRVSNQM